MDQDYQIVHETTDREAKRTYWNTAIGLQQVDGLVPSPYLKELAEKNVKGVITYREIEDLLYTRYEHESEEDKRLRLKEGDLVSTRIASILDNGGGFALNPISLKSIHAILFKDIYPYAGEFREYNITKAEPVLNGRSVVYGDYQSLMELLKYDMGEEKEKSYKGLTPEKINRRISKFTSAIWQVHPFGEGNTRTTAVFMECYLKQLGFPVDNEMFQDHSLYFRNSLVRANYANVREGIFEDEQPLQKFFENLLFGGKHSLCNRDLFCWECFSEEEKELLRSYGKPFPQPVHDEAER